MRVILLLAILSLFNLTVFSQDIKQPESTTHRYTYAYILVEGKAFSKKLKVEVDFGDTPEQLKEGKEYSEILTNKKSYAAVLNYMAEREFELVDTQDYIFTYQGTGQTSGIIFIMRKKTRADPINLN